MTDVLIIHAPEDNQSGYHKGWVNGFIDVLGLMLNQVLQRKSVIKCISGDENISKYPLDQTAAVISIISPAFITSSGCLNHVKQCDEYFSDDYNRMFKVLKSPIAQDEQPSILRKLSGVELYNNDHHHKKEELYFNPEHDQQVWLKMIDLAEDIKESVERIQVSAKHNNQGGHSRQKTIFLAETSEELRLQRNILRRELLYAGFRVLPEKSLPNRLSELKSIVKKHIEESIFSIHLIGESYGEIPPGSDRSTIEIQHQIATEKSAEVKSKTDFARLVWISPKLQMVSERHISFIEGIKRISASMETAEIMQGPLEDFKMMIRDEFLYQKTEKNPLQILKEHNSQDPKVYLLYDQVDETKAVEFKNIIKDYGCELLTPSFQGTMKERRNHHFLNLLLLDAAVIYKEDAHDHWLRMKCYDLIKAPGFGRKKPIKGKMIITNYSVPEFPLPKDPQIEYVNSLEPEPLDRLRTMLEKVR